MFPGSGNGKDMKYDSCSHYDFNYSEIIIQYNGNYEETLRYVQNLNGTGTRECTDWFFDDSSYSSTVASEVTIK
jgi:hypothetical protein